MTKKKKALFVINGFGLGNATRCEGVMDLIKSDFEFDVITSDKAYLYFEGHAKVKNLYRQTDINRTVHSTFGSLAYYCSQTLFFLNRVFKNYRLQRKIINQNEYEIIFFDSDYCFVLHRFFVRSTLVGINNAYEIVQFFKNNKQELKPKLLFSFALECLDYLVFRFFLHHVFCPSISWKSLTKHSDSQRFVCPLIVRERLLQASKPPDSLVLFIVSSSGVQSELYRIQYEYKRMHALPEATDFEKNNVEIFQSTETVFCNAGQSSIAECLYLNKKFVLFPIPRHAEQYANARLAALESRAVVYNGEELSVLLNHIAQVTDGGPRADYDQAREIFLSYFKKIKCVQRAEKK